MKSIIFFAVALAIAGGVIAYIGDRLGTYVGKKRISLIGLRPRHTATLYTTVSGGVIAVLTLGFMVVFDRAFERALVEGPQLLFENSQYKKQIKAEVAHTKTYQDREQQALAQLQQAKDQLLPVHQQLLAAQGTLRDSRRMLLLRQQQLGAAQGQLQGARLSLSATNQDLTGERRDVRQAQASLDAARASVRGEHQEVARQQQNVDRLTLTGEKLSAQNSRLRLANSHLKTDSSLLAGRVEASSNRVIFQTGQELDRTVVKTAQPVSVLKNQINGFLAGLGRTVEQQGGRHGVNGRAVVIAVPAGIDGYQPLKLTEEEEAVSTLAQNIAAQSAQIPSVVIVARATTNTFFGEQASIELTPYDNLMIYPKDAVIASGTIDGSQSTLGVVDALQTFLTTKVRPAVTHQGLIPHSDPQTGAPVVGAALDEATSQALVQQIERLGGPVRITAFASQNTYTSGPLSLRLSVAPTEPPGPQSASPVGTRS